VTARTYAGAPAAGRLRAGGLEIAFAVGGTGEPLLLLNGMTRPLQSWQPFIRATTNRRTVTFDAPGVGGSPGSALPLTIPALARIAAQVLDVAGLDRADVLGYSHGGLVAQQLAFDAPDRVRRLVLAATSCGAGSTASRWEGVLGLATSSAPSPWPRPDPLSMVWQLMALSSWSSIPFLGAIRQPTLVVTGTHDRLVTPDNSTLLARRIPNARLVMLSAGHDLQRAHRARVLAGIVEEFLDTTR